LKIGALNIQLTANKRDLMTASAFLGKNLIEKNGSELAQARYELTDSDVQVTDA
jgi:hypothetical protein